MTLPGSARSIVEHLSQHVHDSLRSRLPSLSGDLADAELHDWLHRRVSGAVRSLRTERPGIPLHAAVCRLADGRGLLISGYTGAGKSTLALSLGIRRGASIVSDDTAWLVEGVATSVCAPVAVRSTSPWWPDVQRLWYARPVERVMIRPDDLGAPLMAGATPVDLVLFVGLGEAPAVRPVPASAAFCRMMEAVMRPCDDLELVELASFVSARPAYEITYRTVDESLDVVDAALELAVECPTHASAPVLVPRDELVDQGVRDGVCGVRFAGGDVALVGRAVGRTVLLQGWHEGTELGDDALAALAAVGLAQPQAAR